MHKLCTKCKRQKPISEFNKRADNKHLFRSHCIQCVTDKYVETRVLKGRFKYTPEEAKQKRRESSRKWRQSHKAEWAAFQANRRAKKFQATPQWLTETQHRDIFRFYEFARWLTEQFNEQLDVDHIIPLNGVTVCGLHVPWNLQIMSHSINVGKGNNIDG